MKHFVFEIKETKSRRSKDPNGYLIVKDNPIAMAGVVNYFGGELGEIVPPDQKDQIFKVCRKFDDLEKAKDQFKNMPIRLTHDNPAVQGAIVGEVKAENPYLKADLIFYSPEIIKAIEDEEIIELSPAFTSELVKESGVYDGESYEFIQTNSKVVNHLAVVKAGRSGYELRVQDEKPKLEKGESMSAFKQFFNALTEFVNENKEKGEVKVADVNESNSNGSLYEILKGELYEIMEKCDAEFEGGKIEKKERIDKILEQISHNSSEAEVKDGEPKKEDEVKTKDEEVKEVKEVEKTESVPADELLKAFSDLIDTKLETFKKNIVETQDANTTAYAEVSGVVGAFNNAGMEAKDMYSYGYETLTGSKLEKGLDAKTAFKAMMAQNRQVSTFKDSKPADPVDEEVLKMLSHIK